MRLLNFKSRFTVGLVLGLSALVCSAQEVRPAFNIFGDLGYEPVNQLPGERPAFTLGEFVFLGQADLGTKWHVLAEATMIFDPGAKAFSTDLDRLYLTYEFDEALKVGLGKRYSPLGYWNYTYHHGAIFQPTIERPITLAFDGGVVNTKDVGVWVEGKNLGAANANYTVMVSNGESGSPQSAPQVRKALTGHAGATLFGPVTGGVSFKLDRLFAGTSMAERPDVNLASNEDLTTYGLDLQVHHANFQVLAEAFRLHEKDLVPSGTGRSPERTTTAGFVYVGATFDKWTPHFMLERIKVGDGSDLFGSFSEELNQFVPLSQKSVLVGIKYAFDDPITLKLEAIRVKRDNSNESMTNVLIQLAFAF